MSGKKSTTPWAPGQVWASGTIEALTERGGVTITVRNTGDRPIQVGSHFHFFEVNKALSFDRAAAWGRRLAIPSGTAVRFEPGMEYEVELIDFGGERVVHGFNALAEGRLDDPQVREAAFRKAAVKGFLGAPGGQP
jgi:urease subunit gamma/beta